MRIEVIIAVAYCVDKVTAIIDHEIPVERKQVIAPFDFAFKTVFRFIQTEIIPTFIRHKA